MGKGKAPTLSALEYAELSQKKTGELFKLVGSIVMCHENNQFLSFETNLVEQVRNSHAGHAFVSLQRANFAFELIRLMALWDRPSIDRTSIPSIYDHLSKQGARDEARRLHAESWRETGASERSIAESMKLWDKTVLQLDRHVPAVMNSGRIESLRQYRDAFIAHNLEPPATHKSPRYAQERRLLATTARIANKFNLILNNTTSTYSAMQDISRGYARALWADCRFRISR